MAATSTTSEHTTDYLQLKQKAALLNSQIIAPHKENGVCAYDQLLKIYLLAKENPKAAKKSYEELKAQDYFSDEGVYDTTRDCLRWADSKKLQSDNQISIKSRDQLMAILIEQIIEPKAAKENLRAFKCSGLYSELSGVCFEEIRSRDISHKSLKANELDQILLMLALTNGGENAKLLSKLISNSAFLNQQPTWENELNVSFFQSPYSIREQSIIDYFKLYINSKIN